VADVAFFDGGGDIGDATLPKNTGLTVI
jgi:hypothetical protein